VEKKEKKKEEEKRQEVEEKLWLITGRSLFGNKIKIKNGRSFHLL
jgi:hypothetical protein